MQNIIYIILVNLFIPNFFVNSYDSCDYCLNDNQCLEDCYYYQILDNYYSDRGLKYYSNIRQMNGPYCGLQSSKRKIASYHSLTHRQPSSRIVGGVEAEKWEFPWIVSLHKKVDNGYRHFCAGTIISDYFIMTAAHCTQPFVGKEDKLMIRMAVNNIGDKYEGVAMKVAKIIYHEKYVAKDNINDIALYKTQLPIKYTVDLPTGKYKVNSICLPRTNDNPPDEAIIAGWGQLSEDGDPITPLLQKVNVPKFSKSRCAINYENYGTINDDMLCYGGIGGEDSCMGDSGGPLVHKTGDKFVVFGVVSFGVPCAVKSFPTIYTEVSKYVDWIEDKMKL